MSHLLDSPLPILVVVAVVIYVVYRFDQKRSLGLAEFAKAHGLSYDYNRWPLRIPPPEVAGFFLRHTPTCTNIISGVYSGANVIAFDYKVGFGRSERRGSGVGVEGVVQSANLERFPGLDLGSNLPWTFLHTKLTIFSARRRLNPVDMQRLCDAMIQAASILARARNGSDDVPGGLHIKPRH